MGERRHGGSMDSTLVLVVTYGALVACDAIALGSYWFVLQERNRLARTLRKLTEGWLP